MPSTTIGRPKGLTTLCTLLIPVLLSLWIVPSAAKAEEAPNALPALGVRPATPSNPSPLTRLMTFVSRADGERCPMYPTCSHYARQAFAEKGIFKGWVLTTDRLLRCGRDETRIAPPINVHGVRHTYDPLESNTFWWNER